MNEWCIWVKGEKVFVNENVFRAYMRDVWRVKRESENRRKHECSYDYMCENGFDLEAGINEDPLDEKVADKLSVGQALSELSDYERNLIYALYHQGKSESGLAKELGIPQRMLNRRKNHAFQSLKEILAKS